MNSTTTELGKMLRKLRIDREETLGDMAERLGCTSSYLSAIEKGKRPAPAGFASKLAKLYSLSPDDERDIAAAADKTVRNVKVDLGATSDVKREAALVFAIPRGGFSNCSRRSDVIANGNHRRAKIQGRPQATRILNKEGAGS